jgi:acyl carrier protein
MVPTSFMVLDKIPLTANGKVDRNALPILEVRSSPETSARPSNAVECELVEIWQEMFNLDHISVGDNFFELGGHSILAMKLMVIVSDRFQVHVPFLAIFQNPTIRQLAHAMEEMSPGLTQDFVRQVEDFQVARM